MEFSGCGLFLPRGEKKKFPMEKKTPPLHAHFTLSSLACVKRDKHLFSMIWLRPYSGVVAGYKAA